MALSSPTLAEARALLLSPLGPVARAGENANPVRVSFEFFPPKTDEAEANLWKAVRRLEPLNPAFVSVTYGAGGSTRERTHRTVQRMLNETTLKPAAHLTCVEASRDEVDQVIADYKAIGVDHIVALRGDPPGASGIGGVYEPRADGYANATELAQAIQRIAWLYRIEADAVTRYEEKRR
jgi:methylenetetrahydrofolate reductase (NADPH)